MYRLGVPSEWYDLGRQPAETGKAYVWSTAPSLSKGTVRQEPAAFRSPPGELYLSVRVGENPEGLSLVDWGRQAAGPAARVQPVGPREVDHRPAFEQIEDADPPLIETEPYYNVAVYVAYEGQVLEISALAWQPTRPATRSMPPSSATVPPSHF